MNTIAYFEIQSSNPARDAQFYQAVFGWQFKLDPNLPIEYYRIETPSIMGGLLKRPLKPRQWNMAPTHLPVRFRSKTSMKWLQKF